MNLDRVEIVDELTCIVHFKAPYAPALNWMSTRQFGIHSKKYFDEVGMQGMVDNPIGTGAFKYASRIPGDSITLDRNDNYWQGPAQFSKVTIKTIPDVNTLLLALQTGDVDVIINPPIGNLQLLNDPNIKWDAIDAGTTLVLRFNLMPTNWVQSDLNFRKAVQYAVDRDAINLAVYGGKAEVTDMMGSTSFTSRPPAGSYTSFNRDLEKAKEYLAASNYDGREFRVIAITGTSASAAAEIMQASLSEIGINMKIVAVDSATFFDTIGKTGDFDADIEAIGASHLDFDRLFNQYALERQYLYPNWVGPRTEEIDKIIKESRAEPDEAKRVQGWSKITSIVNEDAIDVYLVQEIDTLAWRTDIKNVIMDRIRLYRYWNWGY
jgi:peptide/nickel transport system substrate-binding protein